LKQLQEVAGKTLEQIGISNNFLNRTQRALHLRETEQMGCIKLRSFCTAKETVTRLKRQRTDWQKIFAGYSSDKELTSRIYRELKRVSSQRINIPMKKWAHELNREFSKEEVQMANKYMKKCSTSLVLKRDATKNNTYSSPYPVNNKG
jgi:hypothetical protein